MTKEIKTPETHPNHEVVGKHWRSDGIIYFCDSYDPTIGYWMTPVKGQPKMNKFGMLVERRNISERAIGRTYWSAPTLQCPHCNSPSINLNWRTKPSGAVRARCNDCKKTWTSKPTGMSSGQPKRKRPPACPKCGGPRNWHDEGRARCPACRKNFTLALEQAK